MRWLSDLLIIFISATSFAQEWKWVGFEVIGNHKASKADIVAQIPIKVGDKYKEDPASWQKWCADLKTKFKFHFTHCSTVRYVNFDAYFVVEIVEAGYEYRNQFRAEPLADIPFASPEILDLYEQLYKRLWDLFNQGKAVNETTDKGYLDYADAEMHTVVEKLAQLVPKYRNNLLEVLEKDKDINKREKAANLLNWTVNDLAETVVKANRLLDDPSGLVRNNISRFTSHFIDKVQSEQDRQSLIDHLFVQLDRPSHGDRNKAIYNLLFIAQKFPGDRPYIKEKGAALITSISQFSVLDNVRDPAIEVTKLLSDSQNSFLGFTEIW